MKNKHLKRKVFLDFNWIRLSRKGSALNNIGSVAHCGHAINMIN